MIGSELPALVGYGFHDALLAQGVAPAGPLEPAHQDLVRGVQEQHPYAFPRGFQLLDGRLELAQLAGVAADHQGQALRLGGGARDQFGHLGDERGRDVVHDVPPDVLQGRTRLRTPRPGKPGDDQELGHAPLWQHPVPKSRAPSRLQFTFGPLTRLPLAG